jgi:acetyl-CoA acetyltransferase
VAAKSWNQARRNPLAAHRQDGEITVDDVLAARTVATPLTRMMCHTAADGAAAIVVTAERSASSVGLVAIEQSSRPDDPAWPASGPVVGPPSQTTATARRAYAAAGIAPADVDVVSLHDMCVSEEVVALAALGLAIDDEVVDLARSGGLGTDGPLPTNTDGGCIARGHPIGATGLVQTAEIVHQLRGTAEARQVPTPRHALVQASGGGGSNAVALLAR